MKREDIGRASTLLRDLETMERHGQRLVSGLLNLAAGGTQLPGEIAEKCRKAALDAVEAECNRITNELKELGVMI